MQSKLLDLRLLYLAHQVENTFEGLEKAFHRHLPDELRETLEPLFRGGPSHHKLEAKFNELNAEVQARKSEITVQALLQALKDCELMARDFYMRHVKELSDPELVQIFHGMATEETQHLAAVEQAITIAAGIDYSARQRNAEG